LLQIGHRLRRRRTIPIAMALLLSLALSLAACSETGLFRQYEYDEDVYLSLDGSAVVYVNGSLSALDALHGATFETGPAARIDRETIRKYYAGSNVHVARVSFSRRSNRRFVHVRLDVDDVRRLSETVPFAWSTYHFSRDGNQFAYQQLVGPSSHNDLPGAGWTGQEIVAFRLHLPSKVSGTNSPRGVGRGNILVWEQSLAERLRGEPVTLDATMESESILYRTLWLFGATFVAVALVFAALIWWLLARGAAPDHARAA
jgi:hypothetical protein